VALISIVAAICGLVRAAKSDEVGSDCTIAMLDENRNHVAVKIAPRWLAVQQQDGRGIGGALIEVVHAQPANVHVVWLEVVAGEVVKPVIRCA
jgi:hypothetical protein